MRYFQSEADGSLAFFISVFWNVFMTIRIDEQQVRQTAKLARLSLSDEEISRFAGQLSAILEYVEKLNQLDTANVEPLAHCLPVKNVFRDDIPKQSLNLEQAIGNAPQRDEEFFTVPKIFDDSSGA